MIARVFGFIKNIIKDTDFLLLGLCLAASAFGLTLVYSVTRNDIAEGSVFSRDAKTMLIAVLGGIVIALLVSLIDYNFITKMYPIIGAVCVFLLLLTLIIGVGPAERQDAKTWIKIPIGSGFYFQSSELMKIGFIITFGMHLELVRDKIKSIFHIMLLCIHGAVPVALVAVSGDMGSALIFIFIFAVMMFCAGVQLRYFAIGAALITAAAPAIWYYIFDETQQSRILGLIYPDRYQDIMYQQNHGLEAILSGGLTGKGLFNGTLTSSEYVPESENDMIFTGVGEEFGIIGCIAVLLLLLGIVVRVTVNGIKSKNGATSLMCFGFAAMIASQTFINVGMCLKLLPVIGITLPFFSAGGSSNLCVYIGIGLMLSIYRFDKEQKVTDFRLSNLTAFSNY